MDPSGDVSGYVVSVDAYYPVRSSWVDITGVSASYSASTASVGSSLKTYRHMDGDWYALFRTSQGYTYRVYSTLNGKGAPSLRRSRAGAKAFYNVPCEGFTVARAERGISTRVPTTCLGSPWRIRVGVTVNTQGPTWSRPGRPTIDYHDSGFVEGLSNDSDLPDGYHLGPWMTQG